MRSWILGILILIGFLGVVVYFYRPDWTAALFKPLNYRSQTRMLPDDPLGSKYLSLEGIKHTFLISDREDHLLVITGLIKNYYTTPRSDIRIQGRLMDLNGRMLDQKMVYAGAWRDRTAIEADPGRDNQSPPAMSSLMSGAYADSGRSIPFQIVFNQISDSFGEYTLEVAGSQNAE